MTTISDLLFSILAGGFGTLAAFCIPIEIRNFLLWKVPVTLGESVGEVFGIPSTGASFLIGLAFGIVVCSCFTLYRKIRKQ